MINPEEKAEQPQDATAGDAQQQTNDAENANWNTHQQVDEEGNEIDPKDVK